MRGFVALLTRELSQRGGVVAAAAVAAAIPLAAPLLPAFSAADPVQVRGWAVLLIAVSFALAIPLISGATAFGPEMANRRIAFDFARPVSAAAIWWARLTAASVLAAVCAAAVWLPSRLLGARLPLSDLFVDAGLPGRAWTVALLPASLFSLAHAAAVTWKARTRWILWDLAVCAAAAAWVPISISRLDPDQAPMAYAVSVVMIAAVLLGGLVLTGWVSLADGRCELRRAARAVAIGLAATLGAGIVIVGAWQAWILSAGVSSLSQAVATGTDPSGPWMTLSGRTRGGLATFLVDSHSGRSVRTGTYWPEPLISGNGKVAAWIEPHRGRFRIVTLDLTSPVAPRSGATMAAYPFLSFLSADGARLATVTDRILSIHDLESPPRVISADLPEGYACGGFFTDRAVARVYICMSRDPGRHVTIGELDAQTGRFTVTGGIEQAGEVLATAPDGSRVAARLPEGVSVFDGRTGEIRYALPEGRLQPARLGFLSDGRTVVKERGSAELHIYGPAGEFERAVTLPSPSALLGAEIGPGTLALSVGSERRTLFALDWGTGALHRLGDGMSPVAWGSTVYGPGYAVQPGSESSRLFNAPDYRVVRLDPTTGAMTPVFPTQPGAAKKP